MRIIVLKKDLIEKYTKKDFLRKGKRIGQMEENSMQEILKKAEVLIEALPYIQRFNRKIIVVKYGGSAMVDEELKQSVIQDVTLLNWLVSNRLSFMVAVRKSANGLQKPEWSRNLSMDFVKPMHLPWKLQRWFLEKSINHWFRW